MRYCSSCGVNEGTIHITVTVDVFGPKTNRQKMAQFWLCAECEKLLRDFMARDEFQRRRVAKAVCPVTAFVSNKSEVAPGNK
jgi:hypothetical protein